MSRKSKSKVSSSVDIEGFVLEVPPAPFVDEVPDFVVFELSPIKALAIWVIGVVIVLGIELSSLTKRNLLFLFTSQDFIIEPLPSYGTWVLGTRPEEHPYIILYWVLHYCIYRNLRQLITLVIEVLYRHAL